MSYTSVDSGALEPERLTNRSDFSLTGLGGRIIPQYKIGSVISDDIKTDIAVAEFFTPKNYSRFGPNSLPGRLTKGTHLLIKGRIYRVEQHHGTLFLRLYIDVKHE